ncbi:hypothetical protein ACJQWK_05526 [Exserohilum turcicum]
MSLRQRYHITGVADRCKTKHVDRRSHPRLAPQDVVPPSSPVRRLIRNQYQLAVLCIAEPSHPFTSCVPQPPSIDFTSLDSSLKEECIIMLAEQRIAYLVG